MVLIYVKQTMNQINWIPYFIFLGLRSFKHWLVSKETKLTVSLEVARGRSFLRGSLKTRIALWIGEVFVFL